MLARPAFFGRSLKANQALWASFLIETPSQKIYMGGDSGYDTHFAEIGKQYPGIDLAILENGQYNEDWKYIHTMPQYLGQVLGLECGKASDCPSFQICFG